MSRNYKCLCGGEFDTWDKKRVRGDEKQVCPFCGKQRQGCKTGNVVLLDSSRQQSTSSLNFDISDERIEEMKERLIRNNPP